MANRQAGSSRVAPKFSSRPFFYVLASIAILYAFLAGFYTLTSFDLGWQLATGRWIVQHHQIPSTEIFSYTANGQPWIYPVASGILFYFAYLLGGYSLLCWLGALACAGTVTILLRFRSAMSAAIAIFAIPIIAARTSPRADMFTVLLFAAFLGILWQHLQGGKARLWLLPVLMVFWVNLHLGFLAGLALLAAYTGFEFLQMLQKDLKSAASSRLRDALPWITATVFATLLNPWGWNLYRALLRQEAAMGSHSQQIGEWIAIPLSRAGFFHALSLQKPDAAVYFLLEIAIVAVLVALFQRQFASAILLCIAVWFGVRHLRLEALFACLVIVIAGPVLSRAVSTASASLLPDRRIQSTLTGGVTALILSLAALRTADLVTNRFYFRTSGERRQFGAGLSWSFPNKAIDFIRREKLPARIFNSYNIGGYLVWELWPGYEDYIDGRAIPFGPKLFERQVDLMLTDPDGPDWQQETDRYSINTILVPIGRYDGLELFPSLPQFCNSKKWAPIYLDETSVVFVRRTPETEDLIRRTGVDCATAPLPRSVSSDKNKAFNEWANAAAVLYTLARDQEAFDAATNSTAIYPGSSVNRLIRARVLLKMGRTEEAENELVAASQLEDNPAVWLSLARLYRLEGRLPDAIAALEHAAEFSTEPFSALLGLGNLYLEARAPKDALAAFGRAQASLPPEPESSIGNIALADLAQGRSLAWRAMGDLNLAVSEQERAVRLAPNQPRRWELLAELYELQGRGAEAKRARAHTSSEAKP